MPKAKSTPAAATARLAGSRRRIKMACEYCRQRKIRCDGNATCKNCESRGKTCCYLPVTAEQNQVARERKQLTSARRAGALLQDGQSLYASHATRPSYSSAHPRAAALAARARTYTEESTSSSSSYEASLFGDEQRGAPSLHFDFSANEVHRRQSLMHIDSMTANNYNWASGSGASSPATPGSDHSAPVTPTTPYLPLRPEHQHHQYAYGSAPSLLDTRSMPGNAAWACSTVSEPIISAPSQHQRESSDYIAMERYHSAESHISHASYGSPHSVDALPLPQHEPETNYLTYSPQGQQDNGQQLYWQQPQQGHWSF